MGLIIMIIGMIGDNFI